MGAAAAIRKRRRPWDGSLARQLFFVQLALIVVICIALSVTTYSRTVNSTYAAASDRVLSLAQTIAHTPLVAEAVESDDPSAQLQPYALTLMSEADVDFITIMDRDRTRFTHPDPEQLGKSYIGSVDAALDGGTLLEEYTGTLGPSVRAIVPVFDSSSDTVVAMVAVGVTLETLSVAQAGSLPQIITIAFGAMLLGGYGSWQLSRYLRRATLGYGTAQLRRLFAFYNSALHSLREGIILVDDEGRMVLYNDEAATLHARPPADDRRPVPLSAVALPESVRTLLSSGRDALDEVHLTRDRVLVINQNRASEPDHGHAIDGGVDGAVATLRDRTDFQELTGELETMRTLSEALRAQTHEHANRMHTLASLIERGREHEALAFAVQDRQESQKLTDAFVDSVDEPFITALMIGKAAQANERGLQLTLTGSGEVPPGSLDARDLVTVAGNLLDNAFDAASASEERHVWADFTAADGELIMTIADSGQGIAEEEIETIFHLGATEKEKTEQPHRPGRGFGLVLVRQAVTRLRGELTVDSDGGAIFTVVLPLTEGATDGQ